MNTDLRSALHAAVADEPPHPLEPRDVIAAGSRRVRWRTGGVLGAAALATVAAVVVTAVVSRSAGPDPAPAPTRVVRLDLDSADDAALDVVASTRTAWKDDGSDDFFAHDRFEGLTADGLVLRNRRSDRRTGAVLGLLDPRTGRTGWLPNPPANLDGMRALALDVDRLVLGVGQGIGHSVVVFDRATRQWQRNVIEIPAAIEVHVPPLFELGTDGRVYIGTTMEDQSAPMHWWSAPVTAGGEARPEPDLEGVGATWGDGTQLTAEPDGRVVLTSAEGSTVVAEERPADCARLADFPDVSPMVLLAGDVPVVTYLCEDGQVTMIYRAGEEPVAVPGVSALAGDDEHVVLATARQYLGAVTVDPDTPARTYLLDLTHLSLGRVGKGPHDGQVAVAAGLLLWNAPGPGDTDDAYDVVWNVARIE